MKWRKVYKIFSEHLTHEKLSTNVSCFRYYRSHIFCDLKIISLIWYIIKALMHNQCIFKPCSKGKFWKYIEFTSLSGCVFPEMATAKSLSLLLWPWHSALPRTHSPLESGLDLVTLVCGRCGQQGTAWLLRPAQRTCSLSPGLPECCLPEGALPVGCPC